MEGPLAVRYGPYKAHFSTGPGWVVAKVVKNATVKIRSMKNLASLCFSIF